jgi:magnesium transporter
MRGMDNEPDIAVMPEDALRDARGEIRPEFIEKIGAAVEAADASTLRALAGDLHEADMGALLESLDA